VSGVRDELAGLAGSRLSDWVIGVLSSARFDRDYLYRGASVSRIDGLPRKDGNLFHRFVGRQCASQTQHPETVDLEVGGKCGDRSLSISTDTQSRRERRTQKRSRIDSG
jgi:hypothetical protein